jgi:hypothetical protein
MQWHPSHLISWHSRRICTNRICSHCTFVDIRICTYGSRSHRTFIETFASALKEVTFRSLHRTFSRKPSAWRNKLHSSLDNSNNRHSQRHVLHQNWAKYQCSGSSSTLFRKAANKLQASCEQDSKDILARCSLPNDTRRYIAVRGRSLRGSTGSRGRIDGATGVGSGRRHELWWLFSVLRRGESHDLAPRRRFPRFLLNFIYLFNFVDKWMLKAWQARLSASLWQIGRRMG